VQELKDAYESWNNFITDREEARVKEMGTPDHERKRRLADMQVEMAQLRAKIALLKAELGMERTKYVKGAFDARWAVEKAARKEALDNAISHEMNVNGKTGYQLAQALGTKNLGLFYGVKQQSDAYRSHQEVEVSDLEWQWSRFTGTQRYALSNGGFSDGKPYDYSYVLMKGQLDTELEGQEAVFDFTTGEYVSGSKEVFESDTPANRRKRADTLAEGKVKEAVNPYWEDVEN
jgi:hypothetical protein